MKNLNKRRARHIAISDIVLMLSGGDYNKLHDLIFDRLPLNATIRGGRTDYDAVTGAKVFSNKEAPFATEVEPWTHDEHDRVLRMTIDQNPLPKRAIKNQPIGGSLRPRRFLYMR